MKIVTTISVLALLLGAGVAHAAKTTTAAATSAPASSAGSTTHMAAGQFSTEAAAKDSCGSSPVVWVNKSSKVIHPSGDKVLRKDQERRVYVPEHGAAGRVSYAWAVKGHEADCEEELRITAKKR